MNITKQEKKKLSDLITLIKVEYLNEDIHYLINELGLDERKIDKQAERIEHVMNSTTENITHWEALQFVEEMDKIWEDK